MPFADKLLTSEPRRRGPGRATAYCVGRRRTERARVHTSREPMRRSVRAQSRVGCGSDLTPASATSDLNRTAPRACSRRSGASLGHRRRSSRSVAPGCPDASRSAPNRGRSARLRTGLAIVPRVTRVGAVVVQDEREELGRVYECSRVSSCRADGGTTTIAAGLRSVAPARHAPAGRPPPVSRGWSLFSWCNAYLIPRQTHRPASRAHR